MLRRRYRSNGDEKSTRTVSQVVVRKCRRNDVMKLAQQCQRTLPKGKEGVVPLGKLPLKKELFNRVVMDLVVPIHPPSDSSKRYLLI